MRKIKCYHCGELVSDAEQVKIKYVAGDEEVWRLRSKWLCVVCHNDLLPPKHTHKKGDGKK